METGWPSLLGVWSESWEPSGRVLPLLTGARRETLSNEKLPRANEVKGDARERAHCAPGPRAVGPTAIWGTRRLGKSACVWDSCGKRRVWKNALGGCAGPGVGVVDLALVSALEGQNE